MTDLQKTAGDIVVEELYLTTSQGEALDLINFQLEISISESIHTPCLFGYCILVDAVNLLGNLFTGDEYITVKLRSPYLEDEEHNVIHKTFSIYSVTDRKLENDRQQFYQLNFMSIEGLWDSITRISRKFSGGTETIASQIFEDYVKDKRVLQTSGQTGTQDSELILFDTPHSTNNFEFISPYWSPFKCLNFLAKNSIGTTYKMPNVLFYESSKNFYFTSITALIQEQKEAGVLYDEYSYIQNLDNIFKDARDNRRGGRYLFTSPFFSPTQITISNIEYPVYYDQLQNRSSGYYGNTTFAYDFANKDMYDIRFDYTKQHAERKKTIKNLIPETFSSFKHITNTAPFGESVISDPLSVINFKAGSSGLFSENDAFNVAQVTATSFRNTAMAELKTVNFEITVPGKTDIEVGYLIKCNFPNVSEKTSNPKPEDFFDPQLSGIYFVAGVRHTIKRGTHTMVLEIFRDSMGEDS